MSVNKHLRLFKADPYVILRPQFLTPTLRVLRLISQHTAKPRSRSERHPKRESDGPYTISLPAH